MPKNPRTPNRNKLDIRCGAQTSTSRVIASACVALASATSCAAVKDTKQLSDQQATKSVAPKNSAQTADPSTAETIVLKEPRKTTDQQITNAVDRTFLTDAALHNSQIDVRTGAGIVTLTGVVDNLMAKERAAKLAQTIRNVRGVVNTIELKIPSRSDDEIRNDIAAALLYDAATDSYELKPTVKDGVVTLTGTVPSYREKLLAEYVAKGVKGVKEVRDSITLKGKSERSDSEIAGEVKRAIAIDVWLHPSQIITEVKNGAVTLSGAVGSPAQHERANLLAWTAGVKSVNAQGLRVEPWLKADDQRAETVAVKGDEQIKQAVQDGIGYDPRVFFFNPKVEVENGVATLTGVVDNLKASRAAEQDAKNTWGVWRVKNLIKDRPAKPIPDRKLAQDVSLAILRDPVVEGYEINVKAKSGVVALTGNVESYYQKAQAEDIASRANGVLNVKNDINVSSPSLIYYNLGYDPYWAYIPSYAYWDGYGAPHFPTWPNTNDGAVKDDIEDKNFWSPWVNGDHIIVNVTNGVATLTGKVDSWFEYNRATDNAFEGGAYRVYNNVTIR